MNSKNYIIEEWVKNILVHPLTKNKIKIRDIVNKKNIPDAAIFLKNTKGWIQWSIGQTKFEKWLRGGEYKCLDGDDYPRTVIWEFPSYEKANECYDSKQYQEGWALAKDTTGRSLQIVKGFSTE